MIKLYIFDTVADAREFNEAKAVIAVAAVEQTEHSLERNTFRERILAKAKAKTGRGYGVRHCKKCGDAGHRSDNCPNDVEKQKDNAPISKLTGEELHAAIQGLKEDGFDSVRIAAKLKISLKTVNDNW